MRGIVCLLLTISMIQSLRADESAPSAPATLRAELDAMREKQHVPGAVVGVWRPGQPPLRFELGVADVEESLSIQADQAFRIASISKVFVGQVVLLLAGEGKLSIDVPIGKYVPGVPGGDEITLWHLGNHRSGLFNHIESREVKQAFAAEPQRAWTEDELLQFCFKNKRYFEPGKEHHYSNANTVLLAKVIEQVTGESWQDQLEKRVLRPLELDHTLVPRDNQLPEPHAKGYARGTEEGAFFHRGDKLIDVTNTSPSWWGPAGSMISTLDDLGRAAKPLATGQLLTDAARRRLTDWTNADQAGYEYGFHIERTRGAIGHNGDVPGYQTVMLYFPEHDATVVALTNMYGWSLPGMPADRLAWHTAEVLGLAK